LAQAIESRKLAPFYLDLLTECVHVHCLKSGVWCSAVITGPPNGQYSFACWRLLSVVSVVCNAAGGRAGRVGGGPPLGQAHGRSGGRYCTAGQYGYFPLGRNLV